MELRKSILQLSSPNEITFDVSYGLLVRTTIELSRFLEVLG